MKSTFSQTAKLPSVATKRDSQEIAGLRTARHVVCTCGATFVTTRKNGRFCSQVCARKENVRAMHALRYEREKTQGRHTRTEWFDKVERFLFQCFWCGGELRDEKGFLHATKDHLVPLSRGGRNDIENIVPACDACNSKKGTRTAKEYAATIYTEQTGTTYPWGGNGFVLMHGLQVLAQKKDLNRI